MTHSRDIRYIKIYGERNSGTTYLRTLLQANLDVTLLSGVAPRRLRRLSLGGERVIDLYFRLTFPRNLGWKHRVAPDAAALRRIAWPLGQILFLTISKNPYAWLLSLYRHPYHFPGELGEFDDFLLTPWPTVRRENYPASFLNPIEMWNIKHASYLDLARIAACEPLSYEQLLADPPGVVMALAEKYDLPRRRHDFINVNESVKGESGKDFDFYRQYYLQEQWRADLSADAITVINRFLDRSVMAALGYEVIR